MMAERILPDWAKDDQGKVVWLDDDHAVTWSYWKDKTEPNGGILWHRTVDTTHGGWCCGAFFMQGQGHTEHPIWTLESKDPLTLSPSFVCHCGHHGFIRGGKWIGA